MEYNKAFPPIEIEGCQWLVISCMTTASIAAIVERNNKDNCQKKSFLKQEKTPLDVF